MTVKLSADYGTQCCVSDEIGNFNTSGASYHRFRAEGVSHEEAAKKLLASIVEKTRTGDDVDEPWGYDGKQVRYFWFKKPRNYKGEFDVGYEFEELRQEVANYPGVVKLGEYINANTGNMVDGYMIVIDCVKGDDED